MRVYAAGFVAIAAVFAATRARADFDVSPTVVNQQVVTNGFDDDTSVFQAKMRVFNYSFQEDPGDPFFTQDPGFNALANNGLPGTGTDINGLGPNTGSGFFDVLSDLQYWNGTDPVSFGAVPNGESITF